MSKRKIRIFTKFSGKVSAKEIEELLLLKTEWDRQYPSPPWTSKEVALHIMWEESEHGQYKINHGPGR